jgi:putative endonuclease
MIALTEAGAAAMVGSSRNGSHTGTARQAVGTGAEDRAWAHLRRAGLSLVARNYRIARGPHARGGEIDLICRDRDGTLVFVEVRARAGMSHGGAAASVDAVKRARIVFAAQRYLATLSVMPPCRFDVVAIDGDRLQWIKAAFDAS